LGLDTDGRPPTPRIPRHYEEIDVINQPEINPDVMGIPYADRKKILDASRGRTDLADLSSGNPDVPMPPYIRARLRDELESGYAPYTHYYGIPELRTRIAQYLGEACALQVDPETELLVTQGVQQALYLVLRTILRRGDEVLIPSPHYANYDLDPIASGGRPILVPLEEEDGFVPDPDRLDKAVTARTRAILFSNPNNPLGVTWSGSTLERIADLARRHDLYVLVDEVYRDFHPERLTSIAALPKMKERTFVFNGFSKSYFMMGLRTGYVAGPAQVIEHVKQLSYVVALCPSYLGQLAALAAFDCPRGQVEPLYAEFHRCLELLYDRVTSLPGVSCIRPDCGLYIFPNVSCAGMTSLELSLDLIREAGVITLPGTEFGPAGEGHLRLSVCAGYEQVELGARRLAERLVDLGADGSRGGDAC
jgi:aspartate/methionine/tyrosine aminotransferase